MAILATRRRWLVTSRWAASGSSCSRHRLASMYSSSGASIGNLRISRRYLPWFPSVELLGRAGVLAIGSQFLAAAAAARTAETRRAGCSAIAIDIVKHAGVVV